MVARDSLTPLTPHGDYFSWRMRITFLSEVIGVCSLFVDNMCNCDLLPP